MAEYRVKLKVDPLKRLRDVVNAENNYLFRKKCEMKLRKMVIKYEVWDQLCAIMDRLDDTIEYINLMTLEIVLVKEVHLIFLIF